MATQSKSQFYSYTPDFLQSKRSRSAAANNAAISLIPRVLSDNLIPFAPINIEVPISSVSEHEMHQQNTRELLLRVADILERERLNSIDDDLAAEDDISYEDHDDEDDDGYDGSSNSELEFDNYADNGKIVKSVTEDGVDPAETRKLIEAAICKLQIEKARRDHEEIQQQIIRSNMGTIHSWNLNFVAPAMLVTCIVLEKILSYYQL